MFPCSNSFPLWSAHCSQVTPHRSVWRIRFIPQSPADGIQIETESTGSAAFFILGIAFTPSPSPFLYPFTLITNSLLKANICIIDYTSCSSGISCARFWQYCSSYALYLDATPPSQHDAMSCQRKGEKKGKVVHTKRIFNSRDIKRESCSSPTGTNCPLVLCTVLAVAMGNGKWYWRAQTLRQYASAVFVV